jgi:hypothetical protein
VSSGALFFRDGGVGRTIVGELPADSPWRARYARSNPRDTDGGAHPQNVFRVVRRQSLGDASQSLTFRILRTNRTSSGNRNASNGVFLFQRYLGENDLYATGIRVDGNAAIKKKSGGRTYTLGLADLFGGGRGWNSGGNSNFIPEGRAITIRTESRDEAGGVHRRWFVDDRLVIDLVDDGRIGGSPHFGSGLGGIRTDFMDLEFDDYRAGSLG